MHFTTTFEFEYRYKYPYLYFIKYEYQVVQILFPYFHSVDRSFALDRCLGLEQPVISKRLFKRNAS
jgi:hypothetical protein